jgi:CHAD domain-containing protein
MTTTGETTRTDSTTYRGPGGAGRPNLAGLPGVHGHEDGDPEVLEVERYDTDDRALATAGITLAVRRVGSESPRWRLDLPGDSLQVPVAADATPVPPVPAEIDELIRTSARGRAVRPVGRVRTVRVRTVLRGADDVEVVHDNVSIAVLGRETEVQAWSEAEVRPSGADPELLAELERRFAEVGLRPAAHAAEAELDRLLRPAPRRPAGRSGSAGAELIDYLTAQADRIAAQELRVRRGEPDSVHQLRIAARRMRSVLQAYRPLLDRARTEPVVDGLRELGRALAPARDAEVLRKGIGDRLAALDPELRMGDVQALVARHFAREEAEATAAALAALDGEPYSRLRADLDELLQRPPLTKQARGKAGKVLPAELSRTAAKLRKAVDRATTTRPADRDTATHTARKAAKRLRYATEVARPSSGRPAKRFAKSIKPLHKALGEHQDAVVARDVLRRLGARAHTEGGNGFALGVLHAQGEAHKAEIERDLPGLWRQVWTRKATAWLS